MVIIAVWLAAGPVWGSGGKAPLYMISFHEEGDPMEGPRKIQEFPINGEPRHFRKLPVITQRHFKAYWAFPADDGKTWGAVFWLDTSGQHVLQRLGGAHRGQYLAAVVNARPADVVTIDKIPEDGRIVIWRNLSPELFAVMDKDKKIRRIGERATPEALARRSPSATSRPAAGTPGTPLPEGTRLPDDAVVGRIDPATLRDATLNDPAPARGGRRGATRPANESRTGPPPPFSPNDSLEPPDPRPSPQPARPRN